LQFTLLQLATKSGVSAQDGLRKRGRSAHDAVTLIS
jgi:hypothetical protein